MVVVGMIIRPIVMVVTLLASSNRAHSNVLIVRSIVVMVVVRMIIRPIVMVVVIRMIIWPIVMVVVRAAVVAPIIIVDLLDAGGRDGPLERRR